MTKPRLIRDLRVGERIFIHGWRTVRDVHNRPGDMLLLVTDRGEFDMARDAVLPESALLHAAREFIEELDSDGDFANWERVNRQLRDAVSSAESDQ